MSVLIADVDTNCFNHIIKLVNCKSPSPNKPISVAGSLDPLDTRTFKALEPRIKQTLDILLFLRQSSHNCQERRSKTQGCGVEKRKMKAE